MKPQDLERLSAYIDNQLAPGERQALEARLGREPELRAALSELRLTVRALRTLPVVKPPRSFTLTPAQVGQAATRRAGRLGGFGALRLAATLSAVMLAVVVAGDLTLGLGQPAAAPAAPEVALRAAVTAAPTTAAAADVLTEVVAAEAPATEAALAAGAALVEEATPTAGAGERATGGEPGTPVVGLAPAGTATPEPAPLQAYAASPTPNAKMQAPEPTPTLAPTVAPAPPQAAEQPTELAQDAADRETTRSVAPSALALTPLRLVEAGLAVLTVMLALAAWFTRR